MNIILLSRRHGRPRTLQLPPRVLAVALALLVVTCGVLGGVGYHLWSTSARSGGVVVSKAELRDEKEQLQAMMARMAELQARLERLDALGQHLAESANIKSEEFDFTKKPPMGGPLTDELTVLGDRPYVTLRLEALAAEIELKENQLEALGSLLNGQRNQPKSYLANMPVRRGYITSSYGYRTDPFTGRTAFHGGIDFAGPENTDVFAVAPGIVTFAGYHNGYGNLVEIDHGDGYSTRYAHASRVVVKVGDVVTRDQLVAYMGSTGRSSGVHLHYEVLRNGNPMNPHTYIAHLVKR
ncbi:MAG: M23 family metallopeptidase [Moraxellaceae bacterium]